MCADKCQTDYVYVGLAYDNVDLNDNYNGRNIVLRAGDGSFRVFSTSQGCFGGYRSGDNIRVEVDMTEKTATFYKNDQLLCLANGITGPMRPFVSIGSRDVIITLQSHDSRSLFDVKSHSPSSPMLEIAVRTGLDLVFALLEKEDNSRIRCAATLSSILSVSKILRCRGLSAVLHPRLGIFLARNLYLHMVVFWYFCFAHHSSCLSSLQIAHAQDSYAGHAKPPTTGVLP
jgi:hypothetical protein